jgi:hypothetical protein
MILFLLIVGYIGQYFGSSHLYLVWASWESDTFTQQEITIGASVLLAISIASNLLIGIFTDRFRKAKLTFLGANLGKTEFSSMSLF